MKDSITNYFSKIGSLISQSANTIFLFGHNDESISARTYRNALQGRQPWVTLEKVINFLFAPIEKNHCKRAYETDIARAKELLYK